MELRTIILAAAIALASAGAASGQSAAPPAATVSVARAASADFAPVQWVPGTVVSREDARVATEQGGRVVEVADVGDRVERGDALARLDDEALRLRERENRAAIARSEAQLDYAKKQAERLAALEQQSSVGKSALEEARSQRDVLEQDLAQARLALAETQRQLRAAVVRAPFDGIVAERFTQRGEFLAMGGAVARLVNPTKLEVSAQAPVALAPKLVAGTLVAVRGGAELAEHAVRTVVPVADVQSRQVEVRVELGDDGLAIGAPVEVAVPTAAPREVVAVPRDALILRATETFVFRVGADGKAERVGVTTGGAQGDLVEIRGAIAAGDRLVVRGGERLQAGQAVKIVEPVAASPLPIARS
ncbi:MAG TPA: efflux RND transporter periplasmic adaptor subunit [Xanthomonadales bacterium]|nr:efflux RND transporter periplasmic adaptor subunit [Xanthomonadales bacterium]